MPKLLLHTYLSLALIFSLISGIRSDSNATTLSVRMPGANPSKDNAYLCTYVKMPPKDQYIVQFEPKGDLNVAHHMLLFGCDKPATWGSIWNCGHEGTCANTENILFAWANGAAKKTLPKDVGFHVGKSSGIRYLVLQVHYKHKSQDLDKQDNSGFILHLTPQRQPYLAGIYLMWAGDVDIPPETNGIHSDIVCEYQETTTIYAFAFRTHAHGLGRVISGYKVNHNNWTVLGKRDPKDPQAFYPMKGVHKISKGDTLAARCTFDSKGHHLKDHVFIGPTGEDEMCNFYIMYYRDANEPDLRKATCNDDLAHHKHMNFPTGADTLLGTPTSKMTDTPKISTDKHTMKTDGHNIIPDGHMSTPSSQKGNTPTGKMTTTLKSTHKTESSIPKKQTVMHDHKVFKKPYPHTMSHESSTSSNDEYHLVDGWPKLGSEHLGQVSGVALDSKGNVMLFHRGRRVWDYSSFDKQNNFIEDTPIREHTVLTLDPTTGKILGRWGRSMFYLPHGLTVDHDDNVWLTDVATHQVYKFPSNGGTKPLLTVGEKFVPDSDDNHFCKPTDVAVESTGSFYVADGYCNNRIVKFTAKGEFIDEWGRHGRKKGEFMLPHCLSLDETHHHLYIADRVNGRVQILSTTKGVFLPVIKKQQFGYLFALDFNIQSGLLHVINGKFRNTKRIPMKGFTLRGNHLLSTWPNDKQHFRSPHDVISSTDDLDLYVAEINPNRIWKLTKRRAAKENTHMSFPAICTFDKDTGPCRAAMPRWYFDINEHSCKTFIYGGCSGNENNFKSKRECEAKCGHHGHSNTSINHEPEDTGRSSEDALKSLDTVTREEATTDTDIPTVTATTIKPTIKETDDWQNASGEDEGIESNIYASTHHNKSTNHTTPRKIDKNQLKDSDEVVGSMIPALIILSVLAVPIVFLLLISIALRIRAYRRDTRYKSNRLLKTDKEGLAVGRTRGWWSYMNCCNRQNYGFDKVNLAEFYSDSESDGV